MSWDGLLAWLEASRAWMFTGGHVVVATIACVHVLLKKKDPRGAQVWLIVCIFLPYLGAFGYFLFGINRIETRARKLRAPEDDPGEPHELTPAWDDPFAMVGRRVTRRRTRPQ